MPAGVTPTKALRGTDLFLAFQGRDAGFPVLDCADVHVDAIYQASLRTS
jgi:aspartate racemase